MKTIIAGSRGITDLALVSCAIELSRFQVTEVVSGTAEGVDALGEIWADMERIPIRRFPADWERYGKSAGFRRNLQMAQYADALVAVWDGKSNGTRHMIANARLRHLKVYVHEAR